MAIVGSRGLGTLKGWVPANLSELTFQNLTGIYIALSGTEIVCPGHGEVSQVFSSLF